MQKTPRSNYLRYRKRNRLRHSRRFTMWLQFQAERLELTVDEVFELVKERGAQAVADIPTPEPPPPPPPPPPPEPDPEPNPDPDPEPEPPVDP